MGFDSEDISIVFPYDFVRTRVDVAELAGVCEGDATITYIAKKYPDWTPFYVRTKFVDSVPHGKAILVHNTRILMEAEYRNGWLFYKGQKCPDGILLNPLTGCHIVKKGHTVNRDSAYGKLLPEPNTSVIVEKVEEFDGAEYLEQESNSERESDGEVYEDDVFVSAPNDHSYKDVMNLVNYIWANLDKCSGYIRCTPSYNVWYIYMSANSNGYLLLVKMRGSKPVDYGLLYSERTMKLDYVVTFNNGKVTACYNAQSKRAKQKEFSVLDLDCEGHRWEGEIRNSRPNGGGQFYNEVNELIYEGRLENGVAQGYGKAFHSDLGVVSYKGMWRNGMRCGIGTSYDREGNVINHGLFADDQYIEPYINSYSISKKEFISAESYSYFVKVMYINMRVGNPITISNFPFLRALFFNIPKLYGVDVVLSNLESLRKVVFARLKPEFYTKESLIIRSCPNIEEVWLSVQMGNGIVRVERTNKKQPEFYNRRIDEIEIEDHFVLEELKEMGWKPDPDCPEDDFVYYHIDSIHGWDYQREPKMFHYTPFHFYRMINKDYWTFHTNMHIYLPDTEPVRTLERTQKYVNDHSIYYNGYWKHSFVC